MQESGAKKWEWLPKNHIIIEQSHEYGTIITTHNLERINKRAEINTIIQTRWRTYSENIETP